MMSSLIRIIGEYSHHILKDLHVVILIIEITKVYTYVNFCPQRNPRHKRT